MQRVQLGPVPLQEPRVRVVGVDAPQRHPAAGAAQQRGLAIGREIGAGVLVQQDQDPPKGVLAGLLRRRCCLRLRARTQVVVAGQPLQLAGDLFRRQHQVHAPGRDRAARHPVVARGGGVLGEGDAARALDRLAAQRPVRAGAGEHDRHRLAALNVRERAQEEVDRHVTAVGHGAGLESEVAVADHHVLPRWDHVDVVGPQRHALGRLPDGHARLAGQDRGQDALVRGRKVLDEHERHPRIDRHVAQELSEGLQASGRGAHAHDGKEGPLMWAVRDRVGLGRGLRGYGGVGLGGGALPRRRVPWRPPRALPRHPVLPWTSKHIPPPNAKCGPGSWPRPRTPELGADRRGGQEARG